VSCKGEHPVAMSSCLQV